MIVLLIKTELRPSTINGIGLFVPEPVKAGTLIWKFNPSIDRLVTRGVYEGLPEVARAFIDHFASRIYPDLYLLCGDNARFINYANPPNIDCKSKHIDAEFFATHDLAAGSELLDNYETFCLDWKFGLDVAITQADGKATP